MAAAQKWTIEELDKGGLRWGVKLDGELVTRLEDKSDAEEYVKRASKAKSEG